MAELEKTSSCYLPFKHASSDVLLPVQQTPLPPRLWSSRLQHIAMGVNFRERSAPKRSRPHGFDVAFRFLFFFFFITTASAALVPFKNCLDPTILESDPLKLQFVPLHVYARFNRSRPTNNLDITVYGNVSGLATPEDYPPEGDARWSNPNETIGKIVNVDPENNMLSTLFSRLDVLSFTPDKRGAVAFCDTLTHGECPLGPIFDASPLDLSKLHAISVSHTLTSSYAFASILSTIRVISGNKAGSALACIASDITPELNLGLRNVLAFIPLTILILVGVATISAAMYSPWGTTDIFRWSSNYGRDEDLLRLVTPGFGDCLQYIQFIFLTASLTLDYPGYYQPAVSRAGWSVLMFNESIVSHGNGSEPLLDGVYGVNATYGLDRMSKYIGITEVEDIWPGMIVWLLAILGAVVAIIQLAFGLRWIHHSVGHVAEEDLRAKNIPFTVGNIVRIVFNFFLLPGVSLSMFQFVVAGPSPVYLVALAAIFLVILVGFAAWLLFLIVGTRPRSYLFDDLPTVLLYGPLYNTFSDGAAPFALISVLLTFIRGLAIGAVQPSGIAQIVLLAICEVILVLTLIAFRPFHYPTSMNAYHSVFAMIRCLTLLLSVAFVPSLGVANATKGWIGYIILLLHAMVLVFGFFLNAIQTLIEVIARLAGAGGEGGAEGGAARGGLVKVFGMRQLSRRSPRKRHLPRHSITSEAAMLAAEMERNSTQIDGERARSFSGSSAILLGRHGGSSRVSAGYDSGSNFGTGQTRGTGSGPYTPTTPGGVSAFSGTGQASGGGGSPRSGFHVKPAETADPYYRPPRQRRATLDGGGRRQGSWTSGDWAKRMSTPVQDGAEAETLVGHPDGGGTPTPAYLGAAKEDPDAGDDNGQPRTDYAVREVDFYYRVRGPALSNSATRKLKTGPADPTGTVSSASGWIKSFFGGKTKDKGKGFEVVRSARAPPLGPQPTTERTDMFPEPYRDDPDSTDNSAVATTPKQNGAEQQQPPALPKSNTSDRPPILPLLPTGDAIELPSRIGSRRLQVAGLRIRPPTIPRKSSKRGSSVDMKDTKLDEKGNIIQSTQAPISRIPESHDLEPEPSSTQQTANKLQPTRLPFGSKSSSTHSGPMSIESGDSTLEHTNSDETTPRASHQRGPSIRFSQLTSARRGQPTGMGYVQQHRASDHIHDASLLDSPGSTAEFETMTGGNP